MEKHPKVSWMSVFWCFDQWSLQGWEFSDSVSFQNKPTYGLLVYLKSPCWNCGQFFLLLMRPGLRMLRHKSWQSAIHDNMGHIFTEADIKLMIDPAMFTFNTRKSVPCKIMFIFQEALVSFLSTGCLNRSIYYTFQCPWRPIRKLEYEQCKRSEIPLSGRFLTGCIYSFTTALIQINCTIIGTLNENDCWYIEWKRGPGPMKTVKKSPSIRPKFQMRKWNHLLQNFIS